MTDVAVLGSTGYTALELLKILARHPGVRVTALTTRQTGRPHIASIHPSLTGLFDLCAEDLSPAEVAARAEVVFCCLPHGTSMAAVPELLDAGARVIDLSADYRLDDPAVYEKWYGLEHTDAARMTETVYGLPELPGLAEKIADAKLVANPGCYTSTSILGLAPLLEAGLIEPVGIVVDAKSGTSGAGRSPKLGTLYCEVNESFSAYAVGTHRHQPEIDEVLSKATGRDVSVLFTPHLVPMDRGILCTMYANPTGDVTVEGLIETAQTYYKGKHFVRVVEHLPATKHVAHTNYCDVTYRVAGGKVIALSATDNLLKGASGVAVQNLNLMLGADEAVGLL
ncbi:MAG: N-acetyl-gamma-glutamyl-phosphate reductase [Planctomycetota bacterium]